MIEVLFILFMSALLIVGVLVGIQWSCHRFDGRSILGWEESKLIVDSIETEDWVKIDHYHIMSRKRALSIWVANGPGFFHVSYLDKNQCDNERNTDRSVVPCTTGKDPNLHFGQGMRLWGILLWNKWKGRQQEVDEANRSVMERFE